MLAAARVASGPGAASRLGRLRLMITTAED